MDDTIRNTLTQMATYHLVSTAQSALRVGAMRLKNLGGGIWITGCPSLDLCVGLEHEPPVSVEELGGAGAPIDLSQPYIVVLQHPTTDRWEHAYEEMRATLDACEATGQQIICLWPGNEGGAAGGSKAIRERQQSVHTVRNLPPRRFLKLLTAGACFIGNSSVGIRECSFLGAPTINIGTRQRHRERGPNVLDVPRFVASDIYNAVQQQIAHGRYHSSGIYGGGQSGQRVASVLREVASERVSNRAGADRL